MNSLLLCIDCSLIFASHTSCYALGVYYSKHLVKNRYTVLTHNVVAIPIFVCLSTYCIVLYLFAQNQIDILHVNNEI